MDVSIQYEKTKNEENTLIINGLYIHSKYNPTREAQKVAQLKYKPHHLHIVFGYGCGYIVDELIKEFKFNEPILVLDPLIDTGDIKVKEHNYSRLFLHNTTDLFKLFSMISQLISYDGRLVLIENANYKSVFLDLYKKVLIVVRDVQSKEIINVNTVNLFAEKWQINHFFNIKNVIESNSLQVLKEVYNTPVVVVSGGPSLTKHIKLLQKYRANLILVCSGSTINTLLKFNIEPDYVVSIDGGDPNYEHFKGLKLKNSQLLYSVLHHYKINESFEKHGIAFVPWVKPGLHKYLQNRFNKNLPIITGGGSVAHFALTIAKYITTGAIALIGQDLAYTNNRTHAEGNKRAKSLTKKEIDLLEVDGYYSGTVMTDKSLKAMLDSFIQLQEAFPHSAPVYNCTEGGAKILNYKQIPFDEFLKQYATVAVKRIESISTGLNDKDDIDTYYEKELVYYGDLLKLLEKGKKIIKKEKGPKFNVKTLEKLNVIEKKLNSLYEYLELNTLLEPVILSAEKKYLPKVDESSFEEFTRVKLYTEDLYSNCYDVIKEYKRKIEKIIAEQEELKDVKK